MMTLLIIHNNYEFSIVFSIPLYVFYAVQQMYHILTCWYTFIPQDYVSNYIQAYKIKLYDKSYSFKDFSMKILNVKFLIWNHITKRNIHPKYQLYISISITINDGVDQSSGALFFLTRSKQDTRMLRLFYLFFSSFIYTLS